VSRAFPEASSRRSLFFFLLFFSSPSWEYPGGTGIGCNENSTSDVPNFLAFLQDLRKDPAGQNLYLSAAVAPTPFIGSDGEPMTSVSDFAAVLNHITIMNYDINVGTRYVSCKPLRLMIPSAGPMDH